MDENILGTPSNDGTQPSGNGQVGSGNGGFGEHPTNSGQVPSGQAQPQPQQLQPQVNDFGFDPNDETFQAFNQQLQNYIGVDAFALRNYVQHIESQVRENALSPLRQEWGDAFEENFNLVRERFNALPPHQKQIYDNVDGARFLWQQVQAELAQQNQAAQVPTFDRGKASSAVGSANGKFKYTQSEIIALPPKEYKARAAEIQAAYASGLVDLNN